MITRRRFCTAIVTILCAFLLFGCSGGANINTSNINNTSNTPNPTKRRIGFVVTTLSNPYFVDMVEAAKLEAAKYPDIELLVQAPDQATDNERQVQIIENMITQRVSAICVVPADSKSIVTVIKKANDAGIPVLVLDNKVDDATAKSAGITTTSFIGSNNFLGGQLAGKFVAEQLKGSGKVAILEGVAGVEAGIQRKEGFLDALKAFPNIKVVASQTANWKRDEGLNVTQAILTAQPDVNAIFACNDEMALGAVRGIENAKSKQKPFVVGFDAIKDALNAINEGTLLASVAQLPAEVGRLGVLTAVNKLDGKPIEANIPTDVKLITKENIPR